MMQVELEDARNRSPQPQAAPLEPAILVVDDDSGVRGLLQAGLGMHGWQTRAAANVDAAIELLRTEPVSMVLCDYEMPGKPGTVLLEHMSRVYPDLPFVMVTGKDEIPFARDTIRRGALDFVAKPFQISELTRIVEQNLVRAERDRERVEERISSILCGTVRALVMATEASDPYTAAHSTRVSHIALAIGERMRLSGERLRLLEFSALLHDVGKIGIPKEVLHKPGRLDEDEWELVKAHPVRSGEIVQEVHELQDVASIVRHHHERVDGNGYPDRLAGDAIPSLARIIAVADAYEAMTARRAYRDAMPEDAARDQIEQGLGRQFDRRVGEVFLALEQVP